MTTTDPLPAGSWRDPRDVTTVLDLPPAGVLLGADPESAPVVLPVAGPRTARVGVVGDGRVAGLIAYRMLGIGCRLRIVTASPERWRHLLGVAGPRASAGPDPDGWPPPFGGRESQPPGGSESPLGTGAPVLISDLPTAPDLPGHDDRQPGTVVHVTTRVPPPPSGPFWSAVDAVVVTGPGHGTPLARLLGRPDARELDRIRPTQLGLLDHHRVIAVNRVLAPGE